MGTYEKSWRFTEWKCAAVGSSNWEWSIFYKLLIIFSAFSLPRAAYPCPICCRNSFTRPSFNKIFLFIPCYFKCKQFFILISSKRFLPGKIISIQRKKCWAAKFRRLIPLSFNFFISDLLDICGLNFVEHNYV